MSREMMELREMAADELQETRAAHLKLSNVVGDLNLELARLRLELAERGRELGKAQAAANTNKEHYAIAYSHIETYKAELEKVTRERDELRAEVEVAQAERGEAEANLEAHQRWEVGLRNIVTALLGPRADFEIPEVVEQVQQIIEGSRRYYRADGTFEILDEAEVVRRRKAAAVKLARAERMDTALRDIRSACSQFESEHPAGYDLIRRYVEAGLADGPGALPSDPKLLVNVLAE